MVFKKVDKLMVIFAADGARHQVTQEGDLNIISYNVLIMNKLLLERNVTTTQSHNILTYEQVAADEISDVVLSSYQRLVENRSAFSSNLLNDKYKHLLIEFIDLSDRKMLYALTQHSSYSRKFHPFIWCKCGRKDLFNLKDYSCETLSNEEYSRLQRNSKKQFKRDLSKLLKKRIKEDDILLNLE